MCQNSTSSCLSDRKWSRKKEKGQLKSGRRSVIFWFIVHREESDLGLLRKEKECTGNDYFFTLPGTELYSSLGSTLEDRCNTYLQKLSPNTMTFQT